MSPRKQRTRATGALDHRRAQLETFSKEELIELLLAAEGYARGDTDTFRQPMVLRPFDAQINWQPEGYMPLPARADSEGGWRVVVVSFDMAHPVIGVDLCGEVTIGRGGGDENFACDWDLTAFDAANYGVSRQHAILRPVDGGVEVVDLESRNGTRLDGRMLNPFEPVEIRESGVVMLGALELQVRLVAALD